MAFNTHNTDDVEIRPRFKLNSSTHAANVFIKRVEKALIKERSIIGNVKGTHIFLTLPESEQHFWSPAMEVVIEQDVEDEKKTNIRCLIGPQQTVWMLIMFLYISVAVVLLFGGMYGLVKWNMGHETKLLWLIPIGIVAEGLIFLATKWGQKKGRNQMLHLVSFLYHALDDVSLIRT